MGDAFDGVPSAKTLTQDRLEYVLTILFENFPGAAREVVKKFLFPEYVISDFSRDILKGISKEFLTNENLYIICDAQGEILDGIKNEFLSYFKKRNITDFKLFVETIQKHDETATIEAITTLFSHQYKSRPVYLMDYTERNHYIKILDKARDVVHTLQFKMQASVKESLSLPKETRATPLDLAFASYTLDYLTNNKYKILLGVAAIGYAVYDHYHENHLGKAASTIKNGILSFWQKPTDDASQSSESARLPQGLSSNML